MASILCVIGYKYLILFEGLKELLLLHISSKYTIQINLLGLSLLLFISLEFIVQSKVGSHDLLVWSQWNLIKYSVKELIDKKIFIELIQLFSQRDRFVGWEHHF